MVGDDRVGKSDDWCKISRLPGRRREYFVNYAAFGEPRYCIKPPQIYLYSTTV